MNLLASVLPGLRDLRAPVVSGFAWALCAVYLFPSQVNDALDKSGALLPDTLDLPYQRFLGLGATTVCLYLIGSVTVRLAVRGSQKLLMRRVQGYKWNLRTGLLWDVKLINSDLWNAIVIDRGLERDLTVVDQARFDLHRRLMPMSDTSIARIADRVRATVSIDPGGVNHLLDLEGTVNAYAGRMDEGVVESELPRRWLEITAIEETVRGEPEQQLLIKPDHVALYQSWDRILAEAELRAGIILPAPIIGLTIAVRAFRPWPAVGAAAAIAFLTFCVGLGAPVPPSASQQHPRIGGGDQDPLDSNDRHRREPIGRVGQTRDVSCRYRFRTSHRSHGRTARDQSATARYRPRPSPSCCPRST